MYTTTPTRCCTCQVCMQSMQYMHPMNMYQHHNCCTRLQMYLRCDLHIFQSDRNHMQKGYKTSVLLRSRIAPDKEDTRSSRHDRCNDLPHNRHSLLSATSSTCLPGTACIHRLSCKSPRYNNIRFHASRLVDLMNVVDRGSKSQDSRMNLRHTYNLPVTCCQRLYRKKK